MKYRRDTPRLRGRRNQVMTLMLRGSYAVAMEVLYGVSTVLEETTLNYRPAL